MIDEKDIEALVTLRDQAGLKFQVSLDDPGYVEKHLELLEWLDRMNRELDAKAGGKFFVKDSTRWIGTGERVYELHVEINC